METLSFTLGVLSVIVVAFVTILVWGIIKVIKQQKEIKSLSNHVDASTSNIWRSIDDQNNSVDRRIDGISSEMYRKQDEYRKQVEESRRDLDNEINNTYQLIDHVQSRVINDQITDSVTQCKSYTDSRIDKLIDTYFDYKEIQKQNEKSTKSILKG